MTTPSRNDSQNGSTGRSRGNTTSSRAGRGRSARGREREEEGAETSAGSVHADPSNISEQPVPLAVGPPPRTLRSSAQPIVSLIIPPPQPVEGGKWRILVGHLKQDSSNVPKAIRSIFSERFSGWPPHYGDLSQDERDAWASKFEETYTWAARMDDDRDVLKNLHKRFGELYRNKLQSIRNKCKDKWPLDAENPNHLDWLPHRPGSIPEENWKKLLEYWNTEEFQDTSRKATQNAKSVDRPTKRKRHGRKSMLGVYEEMSAEAGRLVSIDEFRRRWGGEDHMFEKEYKSRVLEKYPDTQPPLFDPEIYKEISGAPTRGRWISAPPQLVHPEQFELPQPSQHEIELEEKRQKEMEARLKQEEEIRYLRRRLHEQDQLHRQTTAVVSLIWRELVNRGFLQGIEMPPHLLTGSSSQPPLRSPLRHPEFQSSSPHPDLHLHPPTSP